MTKPNALNWFEIAAADFDRAVAFYGKILGTPLTEVPSGTFRMAMFPYQEGVGVGGSVTQMEGMSPGPGGTMVYLNVEGDLEGVLGRVPQAGGKIVRPRFGIGEHGFIGIIQDSEGNVVGLHSLK
jgi:predicted enzyme related to lactoylglutathione lyase